MVEERLEVLKLLNLSCLPNLNIEPRLKLMQLVNLVRTIPQLSPHLGPKPIIAEFPARLQRPQGSQSNITIYKSLPHLSLCCENRTSARPKLHDNF